MPRSYREWRQRANDYLRPHHSDIDCWADNHVLASLRNSLQGDKLWIEARDHGFWEAAHLARMES